MAATGVSPFAIVLTDGELEPFRANAVPARMDIGLHQTLYWFGYCAMSHSLLNPTMAKRASTQRLL
jgi:hypothetical protein